MIKRNGGYGMSSGDLLFGTFTPPEAKKHFGQEIFSSSARLRYGARAWKRMRRQAAREGRELTNWDRFNGGVGEYFSKIAKRKEEQSRVC